MPVTCVSFLCLVSHVCDLCLIPVSCVSCLWLLFHTCGLCPMPVACVFSCSLAIVSLRFVKAFSISIFSLENVSIYDGPFHHSYSVTHGSKVVFSFCYHFYLCSNTLHFP